VPQLPPKLLTSASFPLATAVSVLITFSHFAIVVFCCCRSVSALGFLADTERLRLTPFVDFSFLIVYGLLQELVPVSFLSYRIKELEVS
jgi:hypothetical protein